jgi:hypothetical protein
LPNPNKRLGTVQLTGQIRADFKPLHKLEQPWTFILTGKPGENPPILNNRLNFTFEKSNRTIKNLLTRWVDNKYEYAITDDVMTRENTDSIKIDPSRLNSIAFTYERNQLMIWLNGLPKKTKDNLDLGGLLVILIGVEEIGIFSLYSRMLSKLEIAEHFVEYQVENFTNDEVLI